jgi:hypothetical protein
VGACFASDTFVPRDDDTFAPRVFGETDWENMPIPYVVPKHEIDYKTWIGQGRKLASKHGNVQWAIGDWTLEGQCQFDYKSIVGDLGYVALSKTVKADGSTGYKGPTVPNFWKDASAETNMEIPTLKLMAKVALAFPPKTRIKRLTFSHHRSAALAQNKERRYEYLQACLEGLEPGQRPRSISWLNDYIDRQEGYREIENGDKDNYVRFLVTPEVWTKLKQLSKYKHSKVSDLVAEGCTKAVESYLAEMAEKVSMARYGFYEGEWPFASGAGAIKGDERRKRSGARVSIKRLQRNERAA